jgi:two-component system cell cycle sensor histidine kinase/response regulator CckA
VMPNLSGPQLLRELLAMQPSLRVLFMSGYSDDLIGRHGFTGRQAQLLQKPFSLQDLTARVREVLDAG